MKIVIKDGKATVELLRAEVKALATVVELAVGDRQTLRRR